MIITAIGEFSKRENGHIEKSSHIDLEFHKTRIFADVLVQSTEFGKVFSAAEHKVKDIDWDRYEESVSILVSNATYDEITELAKDMQKYFSTEILEKHKGTINKLIN